MKIKTGLATLGLVSLLGTGCAQDKILNKPEGCHKVEDIRHLPLSNCYQILCRDVDDNLVLYEQYKGRSDWIKIEVK